MIPIEVVTAGAVSGLGRGVSAYRLGGVGELPRTSIGEDEELARAGLLRPNAARALGALGEPRAEALIEQALAGLIDQARGLGIDLFDHRLGIALGTSAGNMCEQRRVFETLRSGAAPPQELARSAPYFAPAVRVFERFGANVARRTQILAACASSTLAIGVACRWLELGDVELAVAGGYDALDVLVAAGFEALGATSSGVPAPFRVERDGMALGEGAAFVLLRRMAAATSGSGGKTCGLGCVLGFGASSDAHHVTAPARDGAGLARAAVRALEDANVAASEVDLVSAHATATEFNDAAECRALHTVLGEAGVRPVVHPMKSVIGHTLGAAGALETLAALDCMQRGVLPAAVGFGHVLPELPGRLLERHERGDAQRCLKLSAAFGGANAALVVGRAADGVATPAQPPRQVCLRALGEAVHAFELGRVLRWATVPSSRLERLDAMSELVVMAVASLLDTTQVSKTAALVVGTHVGSLEVNARFAQRLALSGARGVPPRLFPATSPNLAAGVGSLAYGLIGPSLAVSAGPNAPLEALAVACDLLAAGDADSAVVVHADAPGTVAREIWRAAGWPALEDGGVALLLEAAGDGQPIDRERVWRWACGRDVPARFAPSGARNGVSRLLAAARCLMESG